ncbi:MAG: GIY-YIG nuclease family protein [candidate division SR1 bacterium]|nr:GIY-YIG nuclease family protein [candidate division SR1 bacterium]
MNWCVYILQGDRFYVGSTNDINRRLTEHKAKGYSTKRIGDWTLVKVIDCKTKEESRSLERKIKKSGHIERFIV